MRHLSRSIALVAAGAVLALAPAVVSATPVQDGCPSSAPLLSVAALEAAGPYRLPRQLDDPANGGNGDGWICGFPLPGVGGHAGPYTIYQFFENNSKARKT